MIGLFVLNDAATTEIYPLTLHDALPISRRALQSYHQPVQRIIRLFPLLSLPRLHDRRGTGCPPVVEYFLDRKSTRLNFSHANISYAVFCLKKNTHQRSRITPPPCPHAHL